MCIRDSSYVVIMLPNILYAGAQVFVIIFGIDKMFGISRFEMCIRDRIWRAASRSRFRLTRQQSSSMTVWRRKTQARSFATSKFVVN